MSRNSERRYGRNGGLYLRKPGEREARYAIPTPRDVARHCMAPAGFLRSKLAVASGGFAKHYGDGAMIGTCFRTETPENAAAV